MSDKDYVIQLDEDQSSGTARRSEGATIAKGGASSRRTSTSSQQSLPCISPNYDSGNFSSSNTSDISVPRLVDSPSEDESSDYLPELGLAELTDDVKQLQKDLQEKNQMLLLAVADARKMRSELVRLMKSEQWYKNELKSQKRSRLELLEKLYLNERRFIEENQKLKADCANLYSVCSELEKKALSEKDTLVKQLQELQRLFESTRVADKNSLSQSVIDQLKFELQKQREFVQEKECLVGVLKKQKQGLLKDLDTLTAERDSRIHNLEASAFTLEQENRQITKRCAVLVEEKQKLEDDLRKVQNCLEKTKAVLHHRQLEILKLKETNQELFKEQEDRIVEIENLKERMKQLENENIQEGCNNFKNLKLLDSYRAEIEKKTEELEQLKTLRRVDNEKISQLEVEVLGLEGLREKYECAEREKEQLNFQLQSKDLEIENLCMLQGNQSSQILGLQEKLAEYQRLKENFDKYVSLLQANNDMLSAREIEIENLKLAHQELQKELSQAKKHCEEQAINHLTKDRQLQGKEEELTALKATVTQQAIKMEELNKEIEWNCKLKQNLEDCQQQLELGKNTIALKEEEIKSLGEVIESQSQKLKDLEGAVDNNSKLRKELENLNQELEQRASELLLLKEICSKQVAEIEELNSFRNQVDKLKMTLEERTIALRERDYEVETLRLVVKGQKAQIRRFNCKCAENEELRRKFEEASNLLLVDRKIFETEASELEFLRNLVERQAIEIGKHIDENESHILANNSSADSAEENKLLEEKSSEMYCLSNIEISGRCDLEEKAHKIELMKAILDKKCDKILQLNCEADQWIELLKNLRISKSRSRDHSSDSLPEKHTKYDEKALENDSNLVEKSKLPVRRVKSYPGNNIQMNSEEICWSANLENNEEEDKKEFETTDDNVDGAKVHQEKLRLNLGIDDGHTSLEHSIEYQNKECSRPIVPVSSNLEKSYITLITQSWGDEFAEQVLICPPATETGKSSVVRDYPTDFPRSARSSESCTDCEVLEKVLVTEHKKKISRYEAHMHTLLQNMKRYKKKLSLVENKYAELVEKYEVLERKLVDLQDENEMLKTSYREEMENIMSEKIRHMQKNRGKTSCDNLVDPLQLEGIHRKYRKSQRVIAVLKSQLETARKQFLEMDDCKRVSLELKFNLDNFVESYKKLISPLDSYKSSIASDDIHDLINRSNSLVPNFDNLSNSIDALKSDIKKAAMCGISRSSPMRKLSLLDELRAADPLRFS